MKFNSIKYIVVFILATFTVRAQEFKCILNVNTDQLTSTATGGIVDKALVDEFKNVVAQFLNSRKWTNLTYNPIERININMQINIKEAVSMSHFLATLQIQASRPVYGTNYESVILNFIDPNFEFDYILGQQQIDYNENTYISSLSSLMTFYAYLVLAYDADSFAKLGGTPYLERVQAIVNNAQQAPGKGWRSLDGTNTRYSLMDNLISPQLTPVREGFYTYHRMGLDEMSKDVEKARQVILGVLESYKKVNMIKPGTILIRSFFQAKDNELIGMFSEAPPAEKQKVFDIIRELDPTNTEKFQRLLKLN